MTKLNEMRLKLLLQQEQQHISESQKEDIDLSILQARGLCWLTLLAEAHDDQANDAERRGDAEQAMGWFADSMRLRDVINLVTSIEIPYLEEGNNPEAEKNTSNYFHSVKDRNNSAVSETDANNINQNEFPDFFNKIKKVVDSLDDNSTKISQLLEIHNQRLSDQEQIDKKLFEKITMLQSMPVSTNNQKFQNVLKSQKNQYKPYQNQNRSKESSLWLSNTKKVLGY